MSDEVTARLKDFTRRLLERRGAIVDWPEDRDEGLAVLPPELAASLGCLEVLPLTREDSSPLPLGLSGDFLERVEPLVAAEPAQARFTVQSAYLKQSDLAALVDRVFGWPNARVRVQQTIPARVEYHTWHFHARLDSADRWEELIRVTVNAQSGAEVELGDVLHREQWQGVAAQHSPAEGPPPATLRQAARLALPHVQRRSQAFVSRLQARLERDRRRLNDYYHALLREDRRRAARRQQQQPDPEKEKAKTQAVQLELMRKLAELDERYAFRLDLLPVAVVRLECPALIVQCHVQRKAAARVHSLFWNALTKALEPMACSRCGASTFAVCFSDETVDPLCPACHDRL